MPTPKKVSQGHMGSNHSHTACKEGASRGRGGDVGHNRGGGLEGGDNGGGRGRFRPGVAGRNRQGVWGGGGIGFEGAAWLETVALR